MKQIYQKVHFDAEVITIGCNFLGFFSLSASDFPSFAQHSCAYKYFHHLPRNISSICLKHSHYLPINVFSFLSMNISSDLQLSATPTVSSFRVSIDIFMTIRISYKMTQMKKHVFPNIWKDMHLNGSSSFQNYTAGCICENLILSHTLGMPPQSLNVKAKKTSAPDDFTSCICNGNFQSG